MNILTPPSESKSEPRTMSKQAGRKVEEWLNIYWNTRHLISEDRIIQMTAVQSKALVLFAACFSFVTSLTQSSTLKMGAVCSSETLVYQTTRQNSPNSGQIN
jgi:hypothetical protein